MTDREQNIARESILGSIRKHLAASVPHDAVCQESRPLELKPQIGDSYQSAVPVTAEKDSDALIEIFSRNLEAVGGHCVVAENELEATAALTKMVSGLQETPLSARRIALSNAPIVKRLIGNIEIAVDEITVAPTVEELFGCDVGISTAQAAIAETGTLMLDSEAESHRLVSLIPAVHIAILAATSIYLTMAEVLAIAERGDQVSPTITFITGPSRTADIELTLAIGVHGPQELFVIVIKNMGATAT